MNSLTSNDAIPMYRRVAEQFRKVILESKWERGALLPSETELINLLSVSRSTIRQAMDLLEKDGLIERKQGKGTFVASSLMEQNILDFHNFVREVKKVGKTPSFQIVGIEKIPSNQTWNQVFGLPDGEELWKIERVKNVDDTPISFDRIFLPVKYAPDLTKSLLEKMWINRLLAQRYAIQFTRVKKIIDPVVIGAYEAPWLQVPTRSLGLLVDRLTWSNDKTVVVTRSVVRSDVTRYSIELDAIKDAE